jgi:hypothetical protein
MQPAFSTGSRDIVGAGVAARLSLGGKRLRVSAVVAGQPCRGGARLASGERF